VVRESGASIGMVYLLPEGETTLRLALVSGASRQIAAPWTRIPLNSAIPVADAIRQRRLIWLHSQEEIACRYPRLGLVLPYDFMLAASPIIDDTTTWGGVVLLWSVWHPPEISPQEQEAVTACCRRAATLLRETAAKGHPLRVGDVPRLVPAPPPADYDPAQGKAALAFTERLPVGCCALDMEGRLTFINAVGADLVGAGAATLLGRRPWEVLLWLYEPQFEDRYRAAVVTRHPSSFTARRPPDSWLFFELFPDDSGVSVQITPVSAGAQATIREERTAIRSSEAPVGATALYQLTHLATTLAEAVSVQDVVELAADQIITAFGPQRVMVMRTDEGRLRSLGHRNYSQAFIDQFDGHPVNSDLATAQVLATGKPVYIASHREFRRAYPAAPRYGKSEAWAFLPMTASGRAVGSLVLSYDQPRPFPPAERALLASLAGLIAQALDRAHLYDAKHTLAHTLQTGLLPRSLPRIPGLEAAARYRPTAHGVDIGGDFYDLIHCTPTTVVAATGDVQGHNTAAAALMGQIRTAVHAHATAGADADAILTRTNRLLTDLGSDLFVSCLIAHIDLTGHRARLSNAGHPPALLRQPDGRTDIVRLPSGLLLGIDPDTDYTSTEIAFPPGAVLGLYTDGLVETPGVDIGEATTVLAEQMAAAEAIGLEDLADTLLRRTGQPRTISDDIALLLLRRGPQIGGCDSGAWKADDQ
jgi:PAS domain-containing protein